MGCVLSNMEEEEKVRICKEKKKLMKQLVNIRGLFSDSQLSYLKALKNTGATLRQFTESESLELENSYDGISLAGPPSPSLPLPPSPPQPPPPPPPPLSPDMTVHLTHQSLSQPSDYIFGSSLYPKGYEIEELETEENWAETNTEFEDEDSEAQAVASGLVNPLSKKQQCREPHDNSCAVSCCTKEPTNLSTVVGRRKKSLEGIIKELDDCFVKASEGTKEIAVLIDISRGDILLRQNSGHQKTKRSNSAKVFNVLSWNRHSKSSQYTGDSTESSGPSKPCLPGAHCATLKKLYAAEKSLSKLVKEEEITNLKYKRESLLLQKKEENDDLIKIEKARSSVENLHSNLIRLQQSISETISSIVELMDEQLYPQLVALTSGLTHMWRTMHECHQAQFLISQQLSHLIENQSTILNYEYHHQAALQLETEVTYWYTSFCNLVKSQREYARILGKWVQHTDYLMDDHNRSCCISMIRRISEQWELGLDKLPDKETSEAINSLLSSIRCIIARQADEDNLQKKVGKLERKMQKELISLKEMETKFEWNPDAGDTALSPSHILSLQLAKTDALKKQWESEKAKYLKAVQLNKALTLNSLISKLPHLFQSLSSFSSAYIQAVDVVNSQDKPAESNDTASEN